MKDKYTDGNLIFGGTTRRMVIIKLFHLKIYPVIGSFEKDQ